MLTRISVRNLACFSDGDNHIDLAPETVIIGPNNVGKSAIIAGFNALHVYYDYGSWAWTFPRVYSWNDFGDAVHRHERGREIHISATVHGTSWSGTTTAIIQQGRGPTLSIERTPNIIEEMRKIWYLGASRVELPHQIQIGVTPPYVNWQPLNPDGSNVIAYLLERFTSRDPRWADAENWLKRITPEISVLKVPLRAMQASVETTDASLGLDINMAYQGTGVQEALSIIAALVFSPEGSTIIVEEPETNLHARSQEGLVDLINLAVRDWKKQVIFTTHSWDMLHPFSSDIGEGKERGQSHVKAKSENFKLIVFNRIGAEVKISDLKIEGMPYMKLRDYLKGLWG